MANEFDGTWKSFLIKTDKIGGLDLAGELMNVKEDTATRRFSGSIMPGTEGNPIPIDGKVVRVIPASPPEIPRPIPIVVFNFTFNSLEYHCRGSITGEQPKRVNGTFMAFPPPPPSPEPAIAAIDPGDTGGWGGNQGT